jgi:hypothetical protein
MPITMSSAAGLALLLLSTPTFADVLTVEADRDNTLYEDSTGTLSNGAGEYCFAGLNSGLNVRRAVMRFDVAGALPAGATVQSVRLLVEMSRTNGGSATFGLHEVVGDWGEGASDAPGEEGGGAPSQAGDATWIHSFFSASTWISAGGDFDFTPSATTSIDQPGLYSFESTPQLVTDVQAWFDGSSPNFGWLIKDEDELVPNTSKRFGTRENADPSQRSRLEIRFQVPGGCAVTARCPAEPSSTGVPARLFSAGDCSLAAANFSLIAQPLPAEPVIFFSGLRQAQIPFGNGWLCVEGGIRRLNRPVLPSSGSANVTMDLAGLGFQAGTAGFQAWYRDTAAAGAGFNTTDALEVVLVP